MSTAGIYGYHPKVEQPEKIFDQMTSGGFQKPFYFGGSQAPSVLGISQHPHTSQYHFTSDKMEGMGLSKKQAHTTHEKHSKIMLPKHYKIR